MKRRDFFKGLGLLGASVFIPKLPDAFRWKQPVGRELWVPNPEYLNAPYEIAFYNVTVDACNPFVKDNITPVLWGRGFESTPPTIPPGTFRIVEPIPIRMKLEDGKYVHVAPYKKLVV